MHGLLRLVVERRRRRSGGKIANYNVRKKMVPASAGRPNHARARQLAISLLLTLIVKLMQCRRRRLTEDRLRKIRARLERFRRFRQRQHNQRAVFLSLLTSVLAGENEAVYDQEEGPSTAPVSAVISGPSSSRSCWQITRNDEWWETRENWSENDWLNNFKMRKATFEFICQELDQYLKKEITHMRSPIPVKKRVAVALYKLATNTEYRLMENLFGVAKSTVSHLVRQFCQAIANHMTSQYIRLPRDGTIQEVTAAFEANFGLPQCVGVLDCTHLPILAPSCNQKDYCNSQGWQSVILQALVDHQHQFIDIFVGMSGSRPDVEVFFASKLHNLTDKEMYFRSVPRMIHNVQVPLLVVADEAYPLQSWVMKPYSREVKAVTGNDQRFNDKIGEVRMVADRAFGRLKGRWNCLLRRNDTHVEFLPTVVTACCILHNICERREDPFDDSWLAADNFFVQPPCQPFFEDCYSEDFLQGEEVRQALTFHISSQPT